MVCLLLCSITSIYRILIPRHSMCLNFTTLIIKVLVTQSCPTLQPVIYEKPFLVLDGGSDMVLSHLLCFSSLGYEIYFVFALLWQLCCSLSLFSHSLEGKKNHGEEMSLNRTAAKSTILVKIIQLCSHIVRHLERSLKKIIRVKLSDVWACMNANAACFFANLWLNL